MYLNTVFKYNVFKYCPALLAPSQIEYDDEIKHNQSSSKLF